MTIPFPILYEDDSLIAIHKPSGILVHRTPMSEDRVFVLQELRKQIGQHVFAIHRLDRGTSGVLLFAKSEDIARQMNHAFAQRKVDKKYLAIVRGWVEEKAHIDYPLTDEETGKLRAQEAQTSFVRLAQSEIDHAIGLRYQTARFSLIELVPHTGRRHQIRKHMAHLRHPIIGDKRHGDVKHNTYFAAHFGISRMLLHAYSLQFTHPTDELLIQIRAEPDDIFLRALNICALDWSIR
jgi:tRNA pseudouridine65 synthase